MGMKTLYFLLIMFLILILLVIFLFIYKRGKVKSLKDKLSELERQRNLIVATPVTSELAKIDVLVKNSKLESKYEEWKKRYDIIKDKRYSEITDKLLEIDSLIETRSYKEAKEDLIDLEMEVYKLRVSADNLLDEIREVTMSEERNRAIVTKLKARFRELEKTLSNNKEAYGDVARNIELQFENIEKKFSDFEEVMEQNEYEEVVGIVKVLDEMIAHIGTVIDESMNDEIQITVIATGFEDFQMGNNKRPEPMSSRTWEKKINSIPSSQDLNGSQNDLDIPSFLRKNKNKNI